MIERILLVGLGSIGKRHLRLARELLPDSKIGVLRHQADPIVPRFADHSFSTMEEGLAFAPQMVVISNPATLHLSSALPFAKAGVHLLIEKPLSASVAGGRELLETCDRANVCIATGYNLRFSPSLQKFKSLLDAKAIGPVWSVRTDIGQFLPSWRPCTDYRLGVSARRTLGGGALLELSHELDYLRWIFGEVDWVQASLTRQSDLDLDVEDSAHLIMGFAPKDGERPVVATANLDFIRHDTTRTCTAIGKLGSLRWNGVTGTVEAFSSDKQVWREVFRHATERDETYRAQWQNFIACAEQNSRPFVTGEDGLKVLHMIEAVRHAATSGSRVDVRRS